MQPSDLIKRIFRILRIVMAAKRQVRNVHNVISLDVTIFSNIILDVFA